MIIGGCVLVDGHMMLSGVKSADQQAAEHILPLILSFLTTTMYTKSGHGGIAIYLIAITSLHSIMASMIIAFYLAKEMS
jgi:hypothetical protein